MTQYPGSQKSQKSPPPPTPQKQYRIFNTLTKLDFIRLQYEHQNVNSSMFFNQFVRIFKAQEQFKREKEEQEQEKKNKIYRDYLASRDASSFSKDFHVLRY